MSQTIEVDAKIVDLALRRMKTLRGCELESHFFDEFQAILAIRPCNGCERLVRRANLIEEDGWLFCVDCAETDAAPDEGGASAPARVTRDERERRRRDA